MAGLIPPEAQNRRARRAAAATGAAAVAPAVEAGVERAAIERTDTVTDPVTAPIAATTSETSTAALVAAADGVVGPGTAVMPEPTLKAEPGEPRPIVTASPPLTGEPSAVDVVRAEQAAAGDLPVDPASPRPSDPRLAAAGQPTLAIERPAAARAIEETLRDGVVDGLVDRVRSPFDVDMGTRAASRFDPEVEYTVLEVVGPSAGRRRAGHAFGPTPRRFLRDQLTDEQVLALRADPQLLVGFTEVSGAEAALLA